MDIKNIWQQSEGKDEMLNRLLQQKDFNNLHSKMPLKKLKNNLLMGIIWASLITTGYIALFFFVSIWQVYIAFITLIFFNTWITILSWNLYKSINENITSFNSLKQELEKNYSGFQKWWSIQQRMGLFVYPIAATGGFIVGGILGSNKTVDAFLYNPEMLSILGITIIILVPLCYFGAKLMFNYAYGKHLKKVKVIIDELSE